jgi:hypothetical protein
MSKTDKIIELKKLLDSGLISQSDFDRLKKQIFDETQKDLIEINKIKNSEFIESVSEKRNNDSNNLISIKKCNQCGSEIETENSECKVCKTYSIYNENELSNQNKDIYNNTSKNVLIGLVLFIILIVGFIVFKNNKNQNENIEAVESVIDSTKVDTTKIVVADTVANNIAADSLSNVTLSIGLDYQGGKIAYIFQPEDNGYIEGEVHGVIMANEALFSIWGCPNQLVESTYSSIGTGKENTKNILDYCNLKSAAKVCFSMNSGGYNDWFLPSKDELTQVYSNIDQLGGYPSGSYGVWSSTEYDENNSYVMSFDGNGNWVTLPKSYGFYVRPIRYF